MPSLHNIIYMVSLQQTSISIVCTMCVYIYLINSTFLTIVYWATIYTPTGIVYNIRNSTNRHNIMWCDDRIVMIQEVWIMTQEYLLIITMCLLIHVQGHTWHTQMVFRASILVYGLLDTFPLRFKSFLLYIHDQHSKSAAIQGSEIEYTSGMG